MSGVQWLDATTRRTAPPPALPGAVRARARARADASPPGMQLAVALLFRSAWL